MAHESSYLPSQMRNRSECSGPISTVEGGRMVTTQNLGQAGLLRQQCFASSAIDQSYLTLMVGTLNAGRVIVNDEPLAGIVPVKDGRAERLKKAWVRGSGAPAARLNQLSGQRQRRFCRPLVTQTVTSCLLRCNFGLRSLHKPGRCPYWRDEISFSISLRLIQRRKRFAK